MLKKFFYGMMAATMLVATSCTDEPMVGGDEATVSFSISTPEIATRAYSDGTTATQLQYAVYDENGYYLENLTKTDAEIHSSATVSLKLKNNKSYNVVFWAAAPNAPYTVDFEGKTMTVDYDNALCNDEARDAFYTCKTITVNGNQSIDVKLKRPFAQINIGTNDYVAAQNAGYVPSESYIKVPAYSTMNLLNGKVVGQQPVEKEFKYAAIPTTEDFPYQSTEYKYLAMTYVLVGAEQELVDVEFGHKNTGEGDSRTVGSVPVRRNYRTNLYGSLLTSNQNVNVEIKPGYDGTENEEVPGYANVSNAAELAEALENEEVGVIVLDGDISLNHLLTRSNDPSLTIKAGKTLTLDLNGKTLSAVSTQTGKSYNMIDVHGALTVKNGTINYKHEGQDMGWNNYAEIFHVDFGGTLNLEGVKANNAGGSAMAYVIDMTNGTDITVNVKNSELVSTYIPVRVFNNNKNGVHNVAINNSKLNGKYCFWVQYWLADGRDQETLNRTLNLDIFDETNTFEYTSTVENAGPVFFGFNNYLYLDKDGYGYYPENKTHYVYTGNALIELSVKGLKAGDNVLLCADIDLEGKEFNGLDTFHPENNTTFDGQGYTVSNWTNKKGASDMGFIKNWVGPVKNVTIKNATLKTSGRSAIVAAKIYGNIENCHVVDCKIEDTYWACGLIAGLYNAGSIKDCTVTGSSIKSNGGTGGIVGVINESTNDRGVYNCSVKNTIVNNTGVYGEAYSGALICGMVNIKNSTVKFIGCSYENNTKEGKYVGDLYYSVNDDITVVVE